MTTYFMGRSIKERLIEDETWLEHSTPSGWTCSCCDEEIDLGEEIWRVRIRTGNIRGDRVYTNDLLDDDGDYLFEPLFLRYVCLENLFDTLEGYIENMPPHTDPFPGFPCSRCQSSIRIGERFLFVEFGEFRPSPKQPNEELSVMFKVLEKGEETDENGNENTDRGSAVCIACYALIEKHDRELWDQPVTENGACEEGVHRRCWRYGDCNCPHRRTDVP